MGLTAPSLKDMDYWEVSRKRKPAKVNGSNRRPVNVVMWTADGSAVHASVPQRGRSSEYCCNALWRRMMCARNVGRIKDGQGRTRVSDAAHHSDSDQDMLGGELEQPQRSQPWTDVGPKLQTVFGMRRWPQGWI